MSLCVRETSGGYRMNARCEKYPISVDWLAANFLKFYFSDEEIIAAGQVEISDEISLCGVYFLIKSGRIVYVGKSKNIQQRLCQHKFVCMDFDHVTWFETPDNFIDDVEAYYIRRIEPELNNMYPANRMYSKLIESMLAKEVA